MEVHIYLILPVGFRICKGLPDFLGGIIFFKIFENFLFLVLCSDEKDIVCLFSGSKGNGLKAEGAHRFLSCRMIRRRISGILFVYCAGAGKGSALADEILYGRIEAFWSPAVAHTSHNVINVFVWTMPLFIKGHGRAYKNSVFDCIYAVKHGGYVPVVADVIRAAPVDRNGGVSSEFLCNL